ncbi:zinc finger protein 271-like [Euwallacea fornicatus]|uniref:zinc finger protein 271-like n=1 Tax=Euwallacea fornicatus TaxID=995702 RepID=UPI00338EAD2C
MAEAIVAEKLEIDCVCRICLKPEKAKEELRDLFQTNVPVMLKFCQFLEVFEADELPNKVCVTCHEAVIQSYKLKQLCISSNVYCQSLLDETLSRKLSSEIDVAISEPDDNLISCDVCDPNTLQESIPSVNSDNIRDSIVLEEQSNNTKDILSCSTVCRYECDTCKNSFNNENDLYIHQSIHISGHRCNACSKTFQSMKCLKRHIKIHMTTKSHTCTMCNKSFVEAWDLAKHSRRNHLGIPREKKYVCKLCDQCFADQYYLRIHERKHSGEKPLKCNDCNKSFYDPRSLSVHTKSHKGIKSYLCNFCGKSFLQTAHLRQHLIVHEQRKPFSCKICDKQFTQMGSVQRHQTVHFPKHVCDFCKKRFRTKTTLHRHLEDEHNIKVNKASLEAAFV